MFIYVVLVLPRVHQNFALKRCRTFNMLVVHFCSLILLYDECLNLTGLYVLQSPDASNPKWYI